MTVYILIYILLVIVGYSFDRTSEKLAVFFVGLFIFLFIGTRYFVGCDFFAYMLRFHSAPDKYEDINFDESEIAFVVISTFVKNNGLNFVWVNVIAAAIFVSGLIVFCLNFYRSGLVLACLFPVLIIQLGMSGIRQASAVAFLMLACVAFSKGNKYLVALLIAMGAFFHASVIVFIPIAMYAGEKIRFGRGFIAILILMPVGFYFLGDRSETYVDRYIDASAADMSSSGAYIRYSLLIIPAILFIKNKEIIEKSFPNYYELMFLFTVLVFLFFPLGFINTVLLHRMIYYVMPVSLISFWAVVHVLSLRGFSYRYLPTFMYGGYSFLWFMTSKHADACYVPYNSYLF